jgi:hypothetical protein
MIPTVDEADKIGHYPVIAQWTEGESNGEYVVLVGEAAESEDFKRLEDAVKYLKSVKRLLVLARWRRNRNE